MHYSVQIMAATESCFGKRRPQNKPQKAPEWPAQFAPPAEWALAGKDIQHANIEELGPKRAVLG